MPAFRWVTGVLGAAVLAMGSAIASTGCFWTTPAAHARVLPSGRTIQVAREGLVEERPWRSWELAYLTDHDTDQAGPVNQEILSIWRELRPEIEKLAVEEATIYAWDARWRWGGMLLYV